MLWGDGTSLKRWCFIVEMDDLSQGGNCQFGRCRLKVRFEAEIASSVSDILVGTSIILNTRDSCYLDKISHKILILDR